MKNFTKFSLCLLAVLAVSACHTESPETPETGIKGALILNNGSMGKNDASISVYDLDGKSVAAEKFFEANGQHLGDLAQDIVVVGDEMFITVNGSKLVFVTDLDLKIKTVIEIENNGTKMSPYAIAQNGGKVYVSYYDGFIAEIEPSTRAWRLAAVGTYPEGMAFSGGKVYVANTGYGYENTISVVDLASFKEEKKIVVNQNPRFVATDKSGRYLYVCSWESYDPVTWAVATPSKLQKVDLVTDEVADMEGFTDVKSIAASEDDKLFVATGGYDADWHVCGNIRLVDMGTGSDLGLFTEESIVDYYSLSYSNGYVFVGASDYVSNGDVYLFKADGTLVDKFDSHGMNPQKGLYL